MILAGRKRPCAQCGEIQVMDIRIDLKGFHGFKAKDHACGPNWTPSILEIKDHKKRNQWVEDVAKLRVELGYRK